MLCAPLQVLFWVAFLLHIALLLVLYFELGLAARGMKTRGALLFYAPRLYAKLRRKLQPQKQRRQKAALLVLAGIAVAILWATGRGRPRSRQARWGRPTPDRAAPRPGLAAPWRKRRAGWPLRRKTRQPPARDRVVCCPRARCG